MKFENLVALMLATLVLVITSTSFAEEKDYWNATSLSTSQLQKFITQKTCYQNENSFLGCIAAVQSLLQSSRPLKILTNKKIDSLSGVGKIVSQTEGLKIHLYSPEKSNEKDFSKAWSKFLEKRAQANLSWKQLYAITKVKPLALEKILNVALSYVSKDHLKSKIADAFNSYLTNAYDPHTRLVSEAESEDVSKSEDNYIGLGVYIEKNDDKISIKIMEDSPAQKAGLRYNDVLTHVDGKPLAGLSIDEISKLLDGPENSISKFTVLRNQRSIDINIIHSTIIIENFDARLIQNPNINEKIGYIKINGFMEAGLHNKFIGTAQALKKLGAQSLILDLRDNGGGNVDEATAIADSYLDAGKTVIVEHDIETDAVIEETKNDSPNAAEIYNLFDRKPLVVLLNANSASAAELLPGALQAYGRVVIVGERSYGKGTMQGMSLFPEGMGFVIGAQLYQTLARFHFANGRTNQLTGISPDFLVHSKPTEQETFTLREADYYPNAVASGKPPKGIDRLTKMKISKCVQKRNQIESSYENELNSALGPDYQLINAREVAACL